MIDLLWIYIVVGVLGYDLVGIGGYLIITADDYDSRIQTHNRRAARLVLLSPIWPLVVSFYVFLGVIIGLKQVVKVAEIGPKPRPKSDPVKIQLMETQNELEDTKRELELVQEQIQKLEGRRRSLSIMSDGDP